MRLNIFMSTASRPSTILVADDDPAIVQLVGAVLEAEGYRVLAARSAFDALHMAKRHSAGGVDLLLSDLEMPAMDGTALWDEVKHWHPHAKVVLMSGNPGLTPIPCLPFLSKPFTVSQLTAKVKTALQSPRCAPPGDPTDCLRQGRGSVSLDKRGTDDAA